MSFNYPPNSKIIATGSIPKAAHRDSNLELFRVIVMLMIIAHHYVVNSGLIQRLLDSPMTPSSSAMLVFGAWGKTGINCFVLITGYFMCTSSITLRKFLKLYLQIVFWAVVVYFILCTAGLADFSYWVLFKRIAVVYSLPFRDFVSAFLVFYLCIPFLNILIHNMTQNVHLTLIILLVSIYSVMPCIGVNIEFNYIEWFSILYIIAAYLRLYDIDKIFTHTQWGYFTLAFLLIAIASIISIEYVSKNNILNVWVYYFVIDSNKIFALSVSIFSFMWFKTLKIGYSKFINMLGASTFGVLLIHAHSDEMRQWLWGNTVDCVGHFNESVLYTVGYGLASILVIFTVCSAIETMRIKIIEKPMLDFFEYKVIHPMKNDCP